MTDFQRRSAEQVAKRAIVSTTLAFRASLEVTEHRRSEEIAGRLLPWIEKNGFADEVDPIEREILNTPYRRLQRSQLTDATFACEGACLFAWAIAFGDPLPKGELADSRELVTRLRILHDDVSKVIDGASLRSEEELKECCLDVLLTLSTMRQRRVSDATAKAVIRQTVELQLTNLGLSISKEAQVRCEKFLDSLTESTMREIASIYFVRSLATTWLFDNRSSYFDS